MKKLQMVQNNKGTIHRQSSVDKIPSSSASGTPHSSKNANIDTHHFTFNDTDTLANKMDISSKGKKRKSSHCEKSHLTVVEASMVNVVKKLKKHHGISTSNLVVKKPILAIKRKRGRPPKRAPAGIIYRQAQEKIIKKLHEHSEKVVMIATPEEKQQETASELVDLKDSNLDKISVDCSILNSALTHDDSITNSGLNSGIAESVETDSSKLCESDKSVPNQQVPSQNSDTPTDNIVPKQLHPPQFVSKQHDSITQPSVIQSNIGTSNSQQLTSAASTVTITSQSLPTPVLSNGNSVIQLPQTSSVQLTPNTGYTVISSDNKGYDTVFMSPNSASPQIQPNQPTLVNNIGKNGLNVEPMVKMGQMATHSLATVNLGPVVSPVVSGAGGTGVVQQTATQQVGKTVAFF